MLKADAASVDLNIDAGTLFLDVANNRIGIANTSPAAALHIGGSGHLLFERGGEVRSKDTGGSVRTIARVDNVNRLQYGWSGAGGVLFMGGGSYTERMRIHTNGYVGIGTTTPAAELSVSGTGTVLRLESSGAYVDMFMQNSSNTGFVNLDGSKMNFYVGGGSASHLKMSILTGGNVGIGTTAPANKLHVYKGSSGSSYTPDGADQLILENSDSFAIDIRTPSSNSGVILFSDNDARGRGIIQYAHSNDAMYFNTAGSTRAVIDSSGNLLVGKTASNIATDGIELGTRVESTADGSYALRLTRRSSDGDIAQFRKDGSVIGNIGVAAGRLYIHNNYGSGAGIRFDNASLRPSTAAGASEDATTDLGASGARFKDLYLSNKVYAAYIGAGSDTDTSINFDTANTVKVYTTGNERMRIDNSGNLLVGTTTAAPQNFSSGSGTQVSDGYVAVARGESLAFFNRISTDGTLIEFKKNGSETGQIGTYGTDLYIGTNDT